MTKFFIAALLTSFAVGCASTHPGDIVSEKSDIVISLERNFEISDKYYYFYEFTIENKTPDWKTIQISDIHFEGEQTEILTDEKLTSWIEGAELKLKVAQYNQDMLLGSIVAVGAGVALSSNNTSVQTAGAGAILGAAAVGTASSISREKGKVTSGIKGQNGTVLVPRTHALVPSKVAPASYIRRWVVVRAPESAKSFKNKYDVNRSTSGPNLIFTYTAQSDTQASR